VRQLDLWRTTPFRLTLMNGAVFALGVVVLLGLIYWQSANYLARQMDTIVIGETQAIVRGGPDGLPERVEQAVSADNRGIEYYGLFSTDGQWLAGNVRQLPKNAPLDGTPREFKQTGFQPGARAVAQRLPWGEVLFVGHDAKVLSGLRGIVLGALAASGAVILILCLSAAAALSLGPLRRIESLRGATSSALKGELGVRLPVSHRRDEIDMLAGLSNAMMDETERLLWEVKSVGDNVAHDLRTPLTRLRALLYRVQQDGSLSGSDREMIDRAVGETDELLVRFRALLRIGEIERRDRQASFAQVTLQTVVDHVFELHAPLAEDRDIALVTDIEAGLPEVFADPSLLFEGVSNLVDNALKFTPSGGRVVIRLGGRPEGPRIEVVDNGPGVAPDEREAVLTRFYRSQRTRVEAGSGLGLSIVLAIARLHHFALTLDDAHPGLCIGLNCWPRGLDA
jgi:signal transduction histidine kinase